jgi:2-iminoacetate synthase
MINLDVIYKNLEKHHHEDSIHIQEILAKARELHGLDLNDVAALSTIQNQNLIHELFTTAQQIKDQIYGKRLVLFAPLYISNFCSNECLYCAFRNSNQNIQRRTLTQAEIANEVICLINQGQKRILLEAGKSEDQDHLQYVLDAIKTIYNTKTEHGEIRRINVNIAPLTVENFKRLKDVEIGTYQLFQETYHPETYKKVHLSGQKADYNWHLSAMDRAMQAGIDDVGIGVLFGLYNWRFEILALLQHAQYLDEKFGIGPHTISVPRLEPASGSDISTNPPAPVSDFDFCKLIAILRIAVPYTGIILSTRETAEIRREALNLGISQISAGSRTNPGGYSENTTTGQFSLGDHRSIDEVVRDVASLGYIPSFCTACYRLGRTGEHFMNLAKTGSIKSMCAPNALLTFQEYLTNYAFQETRKIGEQLINQELSKLTETESATIIKMLNKIKAGAQDIYL